MAFDPNLPQEGTLLDAVQMRSQLNGLKALMEAIPTVTGAQVDAVTTLPPGSAASVTVSVSGGTLRFGFGLPAGSEGPPGSSIEGMEVDSVTTLPAGSEAEVGVSYDGAVVRFTFGLPQGFDGAPGEQGPPGEVSQALLDAAVQDVLNQTSQNSNGVGTLDGGYDDPSAEELRMKLNELIEALRR